MILFPLIVNVRDYTLTIALEQFHEPCLRPKYQDWMHHLFIEHPWHFYIFSVLAQDVRHPWPFIQICTDIFYHHFLVVIFSQQNSSKVFEVFVVFRWLFVGHELCLRSVPRHFWSSPCSHISVQGWRTGLNAPLIYRTSMTFLHILRPGPRCATPLTIYSDLYWYFLPPFSSCHF